MRVRKFGEVNGNKQIGKKAIITAKNGGHGFDIGESVKILDYTSYSFFCKSRKNGFWYVPHNALLINNLNKLKIL